MYKEGSNLDSLELLKVYNRIIPSKVEIVDCAVKEGIQQLIKYYGNIHMDILFELRVILNELILNAVMHGNKENINKFVNITMGITKDNCILLIIADDGDGYDYNSYLKKCEDNEEECCWEEIEETGRGIKIIMKLCDRVEFNKKGNKISILKRLEK
jgi:serine/threonine-protein kinase RsbW